MTGSGNWTYLLPGPAPVLIDAGVGHAGAPRRPGRPRTHGPGGRSGDTRPSRSRIWRTGAGGALAGGPLCEVAVGRARPRHRRRLGAAHRWPADRYARGPARGRPHARPFARSRRPVARCVRRRVHRRSAGPRQHGRDPGVARRIADGLPRLPGSSRRARAQARVAGAWAADRRSASAHRPLPRPPTSARTAGASTRWPGDRCRLPRSPAASTSAWNRRWYRRPTRACSRTW